MKRFLPAFLLIIIVLAVYPFLGDKGPAQKVTGLPWQIDVLEDGATRVFGIVLGRSSLAEAHDALGRDTELAVMQDKDGSQSLEMYVAHYRAGLLSARAEWPEPEVPGRMSVGHFTRVILRWRRPPARTVPM